MKLKSDFVTNSSSSSFVVLGTTINPHHIPEEILKKINLDVEDFRIYDDAFTLAEGSDLQISGGPDSYYNDEFMVGICYTRMKDDETKAQFKERVKSQIFECFGIECEPGHIEECWMDN